MSVFNDKLDHGLICYYATREDAEKAIEDYRDDWLLHFRVR